MNNLVAYDKFGVHVSLFDSVNQYCENDANIMVDILKSLVKNNFTYDELITKLFEHLVVNETYVQNQTQYEFNSIIRVTDDYDDLHDIVFEFDLYQVSDTECNVTLTFTDKRYYNVGEHTTYSPEFKTYYKVSYIAELLDVLYTYIEKIEEHINL